MAGMTGNAPPGDQGNNPLIAGEAGRTLHERVLVKGSGCGA